MLGYQADLVSFRQHWVDPPAFTLLRSTNWTGQNRLSLGI